MRLSTCAVALLSILAIAKAEPESASDDDEQRLDQIAEKADREIPQPHIPRRQTL
jgi:hypothetical protein